MQILVVDDSADWRRFVETVLKSGGLEGIVLESTAESAMARLHNEDRPKTDLILMDISLPGIDGLEAVRAILASDRLRDIPIIVVTSYTDDARLEAAFGAGAVDFVTKSDNVTELLQRVRLALRLKHEMDRRKARERELVETQRELTVVNQLLGTLVRVDSLTGLANRRAFDSVLETEELRALREQIPLSLLMIDVDDFKAYNDHYGHQAGDACLRAIGEGIHAQAKRPSDLAARYGGEEFAVILPCTPLSGATRVAEAIRIGVRALRIRHRGSSTGEYVTLSIGISTTLPGRPPPFPLVEAADKALYLAKKNGRNRTEPSEHP